jgi:hypothetical protein
MSYRQLSSRTTRSCSKAVYKPVWHIPLLYSAQWINSWWWTDELPETCRVSCLNKFVKLVQLVGFITKKFVTMHCHMNVKKKTLDSAVWGKESNRMAFQNPNCRPRDRSTKLAVTTVLAGCVGITVWQLSVASGTLLFGGYQHVVWLFI